MTCNNHPVGYWFPNMGWFHLNSIYLNSWCPGPCLLQAFKISKRYKSGFIWNYWSCQSNSAFHQRMRVNFKGTFFKEEKKLRTMIHFPLYSSWGIMNCLAPQFIIHVPSNVTCNLTLSQTCVFYLPLMMWPILILSLRVTQVVGYPRAMDVHFLYLSPSGWINNPHINQNQVSAYSGPFLADCPAMSFVFGFWQMEIQMK